MHPFFSPKSIAVIGASHNPTKIGYIITKNLCTLGYRGRVYPINPKGGAMLGVHVYADLSQIKKKIDWAVIAIPAEAVPDALRACGKKKIVTVIIISAGFSEVGAQGLALQKKCRDIASTYHMRLLGPNCLGMILPHEKLNASFSKGMPQAGSIGVVSQSGAMAVAITDWAQTASLGFSALISLGNKADINELDALTYLEKDSRTASVVMYLESIVAGRLFLNVIARVSKKKPVVILYPGESQKAQEAVRSHTGAIAGDHAITSDALQSAGAVVVSTIQDLFLHAALFEKYRTMRQTGSVAIITNAGGPGIAATDAASREGVSLASFSKKTIATLQKKLPKSAAIYNPIDVIGDAPAKRYADALESIVHDSNVSAAIVLLTHQYVTQTQATAKLLIRFAKKYPTFPLLISFIGGKGVGDGLTLLHRAGMLTYAYPELAVRAYASLEMHARTTGRVVTLAPLENSIAGKAVLGKDAEKIVRKYSNLITPSLLVQSPDATARAAKKLGLPVVVKFVHSSFLHKSDKNFVYVNVTTPEQVKAYCKDMLRRARVAFGPHDGFLVQPFHRADLEIFIGAKRVPQIGAYMVIGLGGIFVESLPGHTSLLLPLRSNDLPNLLRSSVLGKIKKSSRGASLAWNRVDEIILGISRMMEAQPEIVECDCNPILLDKKNAQIADIRIIMSSQ